MTSMDDFLFFTAERHRIWEQRQAGLPQPWTTDPILASKKMTCVFRVLDPGTQFVLTDLIDPELSERDQLMRLSLYRHTNRVEVWRHLDLTTGYPTLANLKDVRTVLQEYRRRGGPVFTHAYVVAPQSGTRGTDKLDSVIDTTKRSFTPGSPDDVMPAWDRAENQEQRFKALRAPKGVGNFMAMQTLTDWGYSQPDDHEDEFLVPGPGSINGAAALYPGVKTAEVVQRVVEAVRALPDCPRLGHRVPSLMDIGSNLLCEYSKFFRFSQQPLPTKPYVPAHPGPQPTPVLPSYYTEDLL